MSADGITFKCGACGNLMAVGAELRGRPVRCPHCQQVIQAPGLETVAAGSASAASLPVDPPPPASDNFLIPARESQNQHEELSPWHKLNDPASSARLQAVSPELGTNAANLAEAPPSGLPSGSESVARPHAWHDEPTLEMRAPSLPDVTPKAKPAARPRPKVPAYFWLIALLLPVALLLIPALGILGYFEVLKRSQEKPPHPLESIQDDGVYKDLQEGKRQEIINPLEELPKDHPPLKLGRTERFGGLEVTPLEIVRQKLPYSYYRGTTGYVSSDEAIVLRLRLKNVTDILFHPHDPTFNRAYRHGVQPYTFLTIGDKRFYGSVVDPTTERIRGQNFAELLPGEELETCFIAALDPANSRVIDDLKKAPPTQPLTWRIQLRKGREPIKGRQVWVTTVVPVEFTPGEVREAKQESRSSAPDQDGK